jgi:hypothetical protein
MTIEPCSAARIRAPFWVCLNASQADARLACPEIASYTHHRIPKTRVEADEFDRSGTAENNCARMSPGAYRAAAFETADAENIAHALVSPRGPTACHMSQAIRAMMAADQSPTHFDPGFAFSGAYFVIAAQGFGIAFAASRPARQRVGRDGKY